MDSSISEQIRRKIESNDLEGAIKQLKGAVDSKSKLPKISALSNRLNRLKEQELMNVVGPEEAGRERSKIVVALLSLLEEQEQGGVASGKTNKSFLYFGVGGLVVILFGAYAMGLFTGDAAEDAWRAEYEIVRDFNEGRAAVFNQAWGYVDATGALQVPLQYVEAANYSQGLARVRISEAYFYIDKAGNCVRDCENKEGTGDGMKVEFHGNNNQAIDARGGKVIINEDKD